MVVIPELGASETGRMQKFSDQSAYLKWQTSDLLGCLISKSEEEGEGKDRMEG